MHKQLLKDEFEDKIEVEKKDVEGIDMKYIIIKDGKNYKVKISLGDSNEDKQFTWEKVGVEPHF
jgi:hypothetical protein